MNEIEYKFFRFKELHSELNSRREELQKFLLSEECNSFLKCQECVLGYDTILKYIPRFGNREVKK